jgi:hypothetical protein
MERQVKSKDTFALELYKARYNAKTNAEKAMWMKKIVKYFQYRTKLIDKPNKRDIIEK